MATIAQVSQIDETVHGHDAMWPQPLTPAQALSRAFDEARGKLDASLYGSLDRACAMVKNGGVYQDEAGQWYAQRDTDPEPCPANGKCSCPQAKTAMKQLCEHRLGVGLAMLRDKLLAQGLSDPATVLSETHDPVTGETMDDDMLDPDDDAGQGEAGYSLPARFFTVIQGVTCVKYTGLLRLAHQQGLQSLEAAWTLNEDKLSLARAVALFQDGRRFVEQGDSTPTNAARVKDAWRRMSLTRAKARCLRDALGIDEVSVEEME